MTCTECKGSGVYVGFTAREACQACGGTGGDAEWCASDWRICVAYNLQIGERFLHGGAELQCIKRAYGPNLDILAVELSSKAHWLVHRGAFVRRRKKAKA